MKAADQDLTVAASWLAREFHALNARLAGEAEAREARDEQLAAYGKRNRRLLLAAAVLLAMVAALAAVAVSNALTARDASIRANRAQAAASAVAAADKRRLCVSFGDLAARRPPAGNPRTSLSRAYLDGQYETLLRIAAAIGCGPRLAGVPGGPPAPRRGIVGRRPDNGAARPRRADRGGASACGGG